MANNGHLSKLGKFAVFVVSLTLVLCVLSSVSAEDFLLPNQAFAKAEPADPANMLTPEELSEMMNLMLSGEYVYTSNSNFLREVKNLLPEATWEITDEIPLPVNLQYALQSYCQRFDVPYSLALAVIQTESEFDAHAATTSCYGYMQIHRINISFLQSSVGIDDITDDRQNLCSGVFLLSYLKQQYDTWEETLVAYNCGQQGAYDEYFSKGATSSLYSDVVLHREKQWQSKIVLITSENEEVVG